MKPHFMFAKAEKERVNLPSVTNNGDNHLSGIQLSQTGTTADNFAPAVIKLSETKVVDAKEIKLVEVKKTSIRTLFLRAGAVFIGRVTSFNVLFSAKECGVMVFCLQTISTYPKDDY